MTGKVAALGVWPKLFVGVVPRPGRLDVSVSVPVLADSTSAGVRLPYMKCAWVVLLRLVTPLPSSTVPLAQRPQKIAWLEPLGNAEPDWIDAPRDALNP